MDAEAEARRAALHGAGTLVFLCSGNMVRSAFADLYARHLGCPVAVRSAATVYRNGDLLAETARALLDRGVSADALRAFRPTHLHDLLPALRGAVVFLGMRRHHVEAVGPWPQHRARAFLLDAPREIADPVLEGADFGATFARLAQCVEELVRELASRP
jgi:protein-tyrosine-phosphatase